MLYQTIASVVLLATAANAASADVKRQPYRLAVMAMPGQSLMRRDTNGYQPAQERCTGKNSCAEACGASFQQCAGGKPGVAHCFNPAAGESCCTDNSGNSCAAGYYCTHDSKQQTWCCPHDMDLASCAAAYTVTGLVAATAKPAPTSPSVSTSTSTSTTSSITSITSITSTTSSSITTTSTTSTTISTESSTTSQAPTTTSVLCTTSSANMTTTAVAIVKNTTTICTASAGKTTAWTALNSTIASLAPTQPSESVPSVTVVPSPASSTVNAAAASGVSALLLLAAGFIALL